MPDTERHDALPGLGPGQESFPVSSTDTDTVVLLFRVPSETRAVFDHEMDLALDSMEPLLSWLERNGGQWQMAGWNPVATSEAESADAFVDSKQDGPA
ncbi:hypothetical protein AB0C34_12665 [Nocardia sp. NPDC049220]|uniref:hypothetical protein n=1 Tax=Nocardia sp. NPDC049220 TaxID=3155273 RepID=UPI00340F1FC4